MAELNGSPVPATGTGTGMGLAQLRAIAWLRWRILANGYRRKGGAGELIARILLLPVFGLIALLPTAFAGSAAWYLARDNDLGHLSWVLWGAFALTQLLNINLGQRGTTFDPIELIRFPLRLRDYVLVRLGFGMLSPGNLLMGLLSAAVFAGVTIAQPRLWMYALLAMVAFALTNVLFTRMIFAWIDRWLSTRRAREVFTAFLFVGSLGVQYVNVTFNPGFQHGHHQHVPLRQLPHLRAFAHAVHAYGAWLPPELTSASLLAAGRGHLSAWLGDILLCALFGAVFLAVYARRMRTEYTGENLSDQANAVTHTARKMPGAAGSTGVPGASVPAPAMGVHTSLVRRQAPPRFLPATLLPMLGKEFLTMRRNTGLLYGLIAPTVMVFLFAGRLSYRGGSHWIVLGAVAYALLGIAPLSYNSFGLEGTGAQLYFFAPVPLRDVFLAKNVLGFLLALFEIIVVVAIVSYVTGRPSPSDCLFALLWAAGTLLLNTTLGNLRSISAPKKVNPGRTMNKAQSPVSAYIAIGILAGSAGFGAGCEWLGLYLHQPWVGVALVAVLAVAGLFVYEGGLRGIEAYALDRRDSLFEELGKKT